MTAVVRRALASRFVRRDLRAAVVPWMVARVLVGGALAVARFIFNDVGHGPRPVQLGQGLFAWDASFYRDIAAHGYASLPNGALRFFPLYPLTGRVFGWVLAGHDAAALILVANVSALVFVALLHRLAVQETGDTALAQRAAWFGAVFPAASVLVMGYAEGLAMALAVGMFLALRTHRWELAAVAGLLGGLCRPLGVVLVVPAAVEALRGWRGLEGARERVRRIAAVLSPGVGLGIYLVYSAFARDDFFLPLTVQNRHSLRGGFVDPFTRLADAFGDLFGGDRFGSGLHGVWALIFIGAARGADPPVPGVVLRVRRHRARPHAHRTQPRLVRALRDERFPVPAGPGVRDARRSRRPRRPRDLRRRPRRLRHPGFLGPQCPVMGRSGVRAASVASEASGGSP